MRRVSIAVISFLLAPAFIRAQTFEVASVKPAQPIDRAAVMAGKLHIGMSVDGARVDIGNLSLRDLLTRAYRVEGYQISGPDWLGSERFDILAKLPDGAKPDQVPEMLQALLVERFKLAVHRETKEHSVYGLVVGKGGPKLKAAEAPAAPEAGGSPQVNISHDAQGVTVSGVGRLGAGPTRFSRGANGGLRLETTRISMPHFADLLSRFVDKPVVDATGIKGDYDIALEVSPEEIRRLATAAGMMMPGPRMRGGEGGMAGPAEASDPGGSSVFAAVEQLGLKLEPRKEQLTTIVIDHIEKTPTEN